MILISYLIHKGLHFLYMIKLMIWYGFIGFCMFFSTNYYNISGWSTRFSYPSHDLFFVLLIHCFVAGLVHQLVGWLLGLRVSSFAYWIGWFLCVCVCVDLFVDFCRRISVAMTRRCNLALVSRRTARAFAQRLLVTSRGGLTESLAKRDSISSTAGNLQELRWCNIRTI